MMFKEGDRVWSFIYGWAKVTQVYGCGGIRVEYDSGSWGSYTEDGRFHEDSVRTIFFAEIPIPEEALQRPWVPEPGEWIAVSSAGKDYCIRRFLEKVSGKYYCSMPNGQNKIGWNQAKPLNSFNKESN